MHPELFELKALVAGRLDAHRRREIDDHLGSCADCSRHYVALMLGSSSPKTAEAEARQALVPTGAGTVLTLGGGNAGLVEVYGIDAPIVPSPPKPARPPQGTAPALEMEFPSGPARTQVPVSPSLVDAIARLRAEAETPKPALAPEIVTPTPAASALIEPSIFTPTPADGVSIIRPQAETPSATRPAPELPGFMTRPTSASPARTEAQPELVVTFSSTPSRIPSYRSPASVAAVTPTADQEYVSMAVPNLASQPSSDFTVTETTVAAKPKPMLYGALAGGALLLVIAVSGYKYFQSSVSQAAAAAAAAAAKQVQAAAATNAPAPPVPAAAPVAPAPVQTRIVYVERPSRKSDNRSAASESSTPTAQPAATPAVVTLPDVNVSTGSDASILTNTQRSATSELTRSARPTSTRTAAPRP